MASYKEDEYVRPIGEDQGGIRLGDQLDEQDQLLELLLSKVHELEKILNPILFQDVESEKGEEGDFPSAHRSLSPYQERLMAQYYMINNITAKVNNIWRRVQL